MTQSRSQSQSAPDYFDDRLMTERETIISSRATMNQTFSLLEPGVTVIGLIVIPGAYKLSLIAAWVDQTTGMPVFTQYRDPGDPCYSPLLEAAPEPIMLAARISIDRQVMDSLGQLDRSQERPKRKRPNLKRKER
jgi:hypothetical protein